MTDSAAASILQSRFDSHHPPSMELIDKCVHCGFCLPTCPTYVLWNLEMDSPRGRIQLMKLAAEGQVEINANWVSHIDSCLGCVACVTACPSGVEYGKLIEATRAQIERTFERSPAEKRFRRVILENFTNPRLLRLLRVPLRLYQVLGVQALVRNSGILELVPKRWKAMESLLPRLGPRDSTPPLTPPVNTTKRHRVGLLLGCIQREFLPQVNAATARVLSAEGCEVVVPPNQSCCGALPAHAGDESLAAHFARKTIDAFESANVDAIIVNAAGCGSSMKEYAHLLRDDPQYFERAKRFSEKCKDVSEFLASIEPVAARHPLALRVAYHDACHLQHAQRICSQPRALLSSIPNLQLKEISESAICCGSAGIFNLVQPDTARELGLRKATLIAPLKPDVVATGNPGCLLQLQSSLANIDQPARVVHFIQILDASLCGVTPESFLKSTV
jgi:glycolate oxidase iron-sulfur subunit